MRISLNWLKKYVDIKIPNDELIRLIGARLVEVEGVIDEMHKYDKIYVVRVETAEKIEGTHLTLCQINNGGEDLIQVVCGAPNVRAGMLAAWIAPGAIVPASVNEDAPFVIGKRKMLGKYESNGMLAGADELDFGDDHSGIVEIDPELARPGALLADVFDLKDLILDIENKSLTHRPDCFGVIGFAREVAGILGEKFEEPQFEQIDPLVSSRTTTKTNIQVEIKEVGICSRYTAVVLEKHGEMKKKYLTWQDTILAKSGMRPVDPIVDATNYMMLLTGQPLHAFDYDKFVAVGGAKQPKVIIRLARDGEKLTLLDNEEVALNSNDIVITSNDVPVALAGAMGGASTMIDENTRNIILESATFSLYNLRKTQMEHGIFSEAITRFTKGLSPYQTVRVAEACGEMLSDGFRMVEICDEYPRPIEDVKIRIAPDEINSLLGTNYSYAEIEGALSNVGFEISCDCGKASKCECREIIVQAPEWRMDIQIKEDIIEEVGRLLGYDNIKPTLPLHATAEKNKWFELKREIRNLMARFGTNEVLTYSFVSENLLKKAGLKTENSYKIVNSISPELQYVRQSIVPSLLDKAYMNQKIPFDRFALYEINKVYQKAEWGLDEEGVPVEKTRLGFVLAERKNSETPYYKAKLYVEQLLKELGLTSSFLSLKKKGAPALPFEPKRAAEIWVEKECVGVVGEFKKSVQHNFKLADYLAGFEIDLGSILEKYHGLAKVKVERIIKRDLTVVTSQTYAEVVSQIEEILKRADLAAKITAGTIYQPEGEDKKHMTLHLSFTKFDEAIMEKLEKL
ncbi:phenylalanine--tRNA ligase subunit beta [Candidatus Saccharibacteria bacterium]|nr:phenylalanine--tRNA ligase subunit beta [Candidatus Saccharibacteria bacterium]